MNIEQVNLPASVAKALAAGDRQARQEISNAEVNPKQPETELINFECYLFKKHQSDFFSFNFFCRGF